jgi:N-acetylglucosamine kinase-like BadF-type ATPase
MKYFVGIDGGGTSTKGILADSEGNVLALGKAGPCAHLNDDRAIRHVRLVLRQLVRTLLKNARLVECTNIESVFFGVTGIGHDKSPAAAIYKKALDDQFYLEMVRVDIDARNALAGALPKMVGVVVIAGTGSIAFGMNAASETARAGGWGYLLGDPGSAFEIGRQALTAVGRCADGMGPETLLTPLAMEYLGVNTVAQIPPLIYSEQFPRVKIASMSQLVEQAANAGDATARLILDDAGTALGRLACGVIRRLGLESRKPSVSATGGVFQNRRWIWVAFRAEILEHYPAASVTKPQFPPLVGSLLLAYHQMGRKISASLLENLRASLATQKMVEF